MKELQDIASAIRVTSCLLLPLIMNEDEDNILAENTSGLIERFHLISWDFLLLKVFFHYSRE